MECRSSSKVLSTLHFGMWTWLLPSFSRALYDSIFLSSQCFSQWFFVEKLSSYALKNTAIIPTDWWWESCWKESESSLITSELMAFPTVAQMPTAPQPRSIIWRQTLCCWQEFQTAVQGLGNEKRDFLFFQPLCYILWKQIFKWQQELVPLFKASMPVIMIVSQQIWIISFGAVLERN